MLTERTLKTLPPGRHAAGDRLYLRVGKTRRSWVLRSQSGRGAYITLGHYPQMTLREARNRAAEHTGISLTLRTAWERYRPLLERDYKRPDYVTSRFERDVLPEVGDTQLARVTRADLTALLQKVVDRGSPIAANRTLTDLKRFFEICIEKGWITGNPASGIKRRAVGGAERSGNRILTFAELEAYIAMLLTDRFDLRTRIALGLVLLTCQRSTEVLWICNKEIRGAWWVIPKERMKQVRGKMPRRDQKVYLAPAARLLLRIALRTYGPRPFVGMRHTTLSQAVSRMKFDPPFTPHDSRRTMTTLLNDHYGVLPHVTEQMLYHLMTGVMAVYNHAEYLKERRDAWNIWGRVLVALRRRVRRGGAEGRELGRPAVGRAPDGVGRAHSDPADLLRPRDYVSLRG